ncbi:hypothetical protein PVK06_005692 [Gossypium arboreum]|uniref:Uncharacterized protein n=1 Tax=Gossypium arboreum TaxID=29729 RepID=A0ABR0QWI6_GOSAR|nr:hypothetical protein PVK06_005692 [Gossypium arboreum]
MESDNGWVCKVCIRCDTIDHIGSNSTHDNQEIEVSDGHENDDHENSSIVVQKGNDDPTHSIGNNASANVSANEEDPSMNVEEN